MSAKMANKTESTNKLINIRAAEVAPEKPSELGSARGRRRDIAKHDALKVESEVILPEEFVTLFFFMM